MPLSHDALDVAFESTPPSSWCNEERIEKAIQSMPTLNGRLESIELSVDPDTQATVTDFLDFTEYLPSDMIRSLTLIGNLDQIYCDASSNVNNLTTKYSVNPDSLVEKGLEPTQIRVDISQYLNEAMNVRVLAHAEAIRMAENVERHYNRINNILMKLQVMADNYPPSREASPITATKSKSPLKNHSVSAPPKLTLRLDSRHERESRAHKKHNLRITVPGEVLAPYELDYPSYDDEESGEDQESGQIKSHNHPKASFSCRGTSGSSGSSSSESKYHIKATNKKNKPQRGSETPGITSTNVHSSVSGISTSDALVQLEPPPPNAKPGDKELPWLQLNAWELAKLRKRMKKNAIWCPSDTMIARELKSLGRGLEAYKFAVQRAEAAGQAKSIEIPPQIRGETIHAEGAISVEAIRYLESQICNQGEIALIETKEKKREKELALAAEQAEEAARKMAASAEAMKDLFKNPTNTSNQSFTHTPISESNLEVIRDQGSQGDKFTDKALKGKKYPLNRKPTTIRLHKRKREVEEDLEGDNIEEKEGKCAFNEDEECRENGEQRGSRAERDKNKMELLESEVTKKIRPPPLKKSKTETSSSMSVQQCGTSIVSSTNSLDLSTPSAISELGVPRAESFLEVPRKSPIIPIISPKKTTIPISLPPKEPPKLLLKKDGKVAIETAANTRPRRTSVAVGQITTPHIGTEVTISKPAISSRCYKSNGIDGMSLTATATIDRPRRTSTARITPVPDMRTQSKRHKRPAPGVITTNSTGSSTVSVGKRSAATRKKPGSKKDKKDSNESHLTQEIFDEIDDEGNVIDPNEPRYCHCNRVSFGMMIGCEGANVSHALTYKVSLFLWKKIMNIFLT